MELNNECMTVLQAQEQLFSTLPQLKHADLLNTFLDLAYHHQLSIAMWRMPRSDEKHVITDISGTAAKGKPDLEQMGKGCLFAPFNNPNGQESRFIRADVHYATKMEQLHTNPALANDAEQPQGKRLKVLLADLEARLHQPPAKGKYHVRKGHHPSPGTQQQAYQQLVRQAIEHIEAGHFQKVVPARTHAIPLSENFDAIHLFEKLCQKYPNTFVSLVSVPEVGTWMGASPETLISVDHTTNTFTTVALAGTQPHIPGVRLRDVAWRQKEIEEQAMVSRYIINCFKKIRLREFEEAGPHTVIAGNLMHLRTSFYVNMQAVNFPELGTVMTELLHPTSAVCGLPKPPALDFIKQHEGFNREYFSGFLGPVHIQDTTHLFVNLRCMQLFEQQATLYAGAGVTQDSEPDKEWHETQIKCQTLLNVIEQSR